MRQKKQTLKTITTKTKMQKTENGKMKTKKQKQ